MSIVRINSDYRHLESAASTKQSWMETIKAHCHSVEKGHPVTILLHGYRYGPNSASNNPHNTIYGFSESEDWRVAPWPNRLATTGSLIAYAWDALARYQSEMSNIGDIYERAAAEAQKFALLLTNLYEQEPSRPIHILCHSIGARVALRAIASLPNSCSIKLVMMGGAEYMDAVPATLANKSNLEVYNITAYQNVFYDRLFSWFGPHSGSKTIHQTSEAPAKNWVNLPLDHPDFETALSKRNIALGHSARRFSHWDFFKREGVFALYNAILSDSAGFEHTSLQQVSSSLAPLTRLRVATDNITRFYHWCTEARMRSEQPTRPQRRSHILRRG